ncbi:Outward-rectifier potassium channel TOK1 [Zalerion maritima]|uniref:Outward-rectifier potassium channel TOK1 n=1 Tax=Zalerion maritima TaxID=339359 RepID=A0AAD5RME1_9PEZI|nr:Outward-rectifier potassium channel TOK1 [Zalerion maritima]
MNNADLEQRIGEHAKTFEAKRNERKGTRRFTNADDAHLRPSRWWFASSAFPMIAGTLGPVASAFSICALVRPWRQYLPPGTEITAAPFMDDPVWLLVVNAIQLAMAIVSNIFLLLNMTRRVRFSIAQPVTIVGWYISAICLMSLAASGAGPLVPKDVPYDEWVWSQAFFYGIWAAILYFVVSTLMLITIYGAWKGHYAKDFNLTSSQRTLMLQTIMFLMYLLLGALVFSKTEGWSYLDAVYWADVTLFTVGFGDLSTDSPAGRALLFPYALVGVISLGLVIGSIRSLALERGQRKLDARFVEKKRRKKLKKLEQEGAAKMLKPIHGAEKRVNTNDMSGDFLTEYQRREQEFVLMRQIQEEASRRNRWVALSISLTVWLILWLVGAVIFLACEAPYQSGWGYYDAFYFVFVSFTTIGYGDRTPISNAGRSFFVFWSLLTLPTMTVLISNAGDTVIKFIRDSTITLGNITIMPGDRGFQADFKEVLRSMSCGLLFKEEFPTTAPGFLGETNQTYGTDTEAGLSHHTHTLLPDQHEDDEPGGFKSPSNDREDIGNGNGLLGPQSELRPRTSYTGSAAGRSSQEVPSGGHAMQRRMTHRPKALTRTSSNHIIPTRLPATREGYHFALIKEIARVTGHMKQHTTKKYSFAEWAWFLALMGEDEGSSETHRAVHNDNFSEKTHLTDQNQERVKWSWVGKRSPLMGSQDEPEWVLERLTHKLSEELEEVKRRAELGAFERQ